MRVAEITKTANHSGIATMIWNFCSHIKNREINMDIYSPSNPYFKKCEENNLDTRISFIETAFSDKNKIKKYLKYYFIIRKSLKGKKYDIIHIHSDTDFYTIVTILAVRKIKARIILHAHNDATESKIINTIAKWVILLHKCTLLSCSDKAANAMFPKKLKWVWIKNGINSSEYKFSAVNRNKYREKYGIKEDEILVGTVGRLEKQKNYSYLISVFANTIKERNARLMIIGRGSQFGELVEQATKKRIKEKVIFVESSFEVGKILSAFDYFVLPSLHEGLPVVAVEAQACGLPTIISDKVSSMTIITDRCEQLGIDSGSITKWSASISSNSVSDREKYAKIVKDAGFDISGTAKQIEEIYEGLK